METEVHGRSAFMCTLYKVLRVN